jgi:hypothetical protein
MNDKEFIEKIAKLWIELGGDAEGLCWSWRELYKEIERQLEKIRK